MKRQIKATRNGPRRCPSGKTRFRDRSSANAALKNIGGQSRRGKVPVRVYECGKCSGFHLTSQERPS